MKVPRVIHVSKYYLPFRGGLETVVRELCTGLRDLRVPVEILASATGRKASREEWEGIPVTKLSRWAVVRSAPFSPAAVSFFRRERPDLFHFHFPNPGMEMAWLASGNRTPVVVTYHANIVRQKILRRAYDPFLRRFFGRVAGVSVPTEYHIRYSPILRQMPERCAVIPFGFAPEEYDLTPGAIKKLEELRQRFPGPPPALFIGRLVPYKGVAVLLDALAQTEGRLVILGGGPEEARLRGQAAQLGLTERITWRPGTGGDEKLAWLHFCRLLVLPSIHTTENFGLVQLEAFACRKPVVSTRLESGVRAVNRDGETGFQVPVGDAGALAQAMNRLEQEPGLADTLGENAHRLFLAEYRREVFAARHLDWYRKVLERDI